MGFWCPTLAKKSNNFKTVDADDQEAKKKRPCLNRVITSIVKKIKLFLVTDFNFYACFLCFCEFILSSFALFLLQDTFLHFLPNKVLNH